MCTYKRKFKFFCLTQILQLKIEYTSAPSKGRKKYMLWYFKNLFKTKALLLDPARTILWSTLYSEIQFKPTQATKTEIA
jgi:hypothetical protein